MYDEMPDAVLVLGADGLIAGANPAALTLLGGDVRGGAALIGASVQQVARLVDAAGRDWWDCEATARTLRSVTRVPERRLSVRSAVGGADIDVMLTARYVRERGKLRRVVLVLRDTRNRERLERSHADLISTVAHELRSPLTSVKGFTATMLAKWERFTDEQKRQMLEWVNSDADRVTRLLAELLDVSRIDAGRLELHRQVVDLGGVVRRIVAGRVAAAEGDDRFVVHEDGVPPELWLDLDKMEQVVGNLIENALRHGSGTVTVTVMAAEGGAQVFVDDEGPGVPVDIAGLIFTKFFRGKARRGGTGLGLYIVKGLVEAHGGTVAVERSPVGGARFHFAVPAGQPAYSR